MLLSAWFSPGKFVISPQFLSIDAGEKSFTCIASYGFLLMKMWPITPGGGPHL